MYPINPDTKLISISKVIVFPDSTLSTTSIKSYIKQFFELNQSGGTKNVDKLSKRNRSKMPSFTTGISLDQDSLIVYDCDMELNYVHGAIGQSLITQEGGDHFGFKIKTFIKKGKLRYEFTNMIHAYIFSGIY